MSVFHCGRAPPNFVVEPSRAESSRAAPRAHPRHVRELIDARIRVRRYMACEQGCERARTSATNDDDEPDVCQGERYTEDRWKKCEFHDSQQYIIKCPVHTLHTKCDIYSRHIPRKIWSHNFCAQYIFIHFNFNISFAQ